MTKHLPQRPMTGGTNNGIRPARYHYWRVGYGAQESFALDFWVERAGEFHCKPGYVTGSVDHPDSTQVFYHLAGDATFDAGGQTRPVARGDLLIIPYGHRAIYSGGNGMKYHWFALGQRWPSIFGPAPRPQFLSPGYDAEVEARFAEIREILILRQPGYPLKAVGVIYELMARIEAITQTPAPAESAYPEAVRNAIIYLRENYMAPFDAAQTAAAVSLSQSHLRALFEKWVGESPRQFHTRCRIDQAKRLLSEQHLAVAEVALLVGFGDGRYFSRVFKQMTGLPPSRYPDNG
jgi:AraC-like DNA-binding protein